MKISTTTSTILEEDLYKSNLIESLNHQRGCYFSCDYEYPKRYERWEVGFNEIIMTFKSKGYYFELSSESVLGRKLLNRIHPMLLAECWTDALSLSRGSASSYLCGRVKEPTNKPVDETEIRQQNSIFTLIRCLMNFFESDSSHFGFYGNLGYDLVHQIEPITTCIERGNAYPDLVLFLPEAVYVKANKYQCAERHQFIFECDPEIVPEPKILPDPEAKLNLEAELDYQTHFKSFFRHTNVYKNKQKFTLDDYSHLVASVKKEFECGNLFEVVPSYNRYHNTTETPSVLFNRLRSLNPSPYHFLISMDENDHLIGASPEIYVRVKDRIVETCPISGTIKRGKNAIEDHLQIRTLLNSFKDENELTMCTDVDRNDKSKVCSPETIEVVGRRQIELYSHLIHTVDHVKGTLKPDQDSLDAFIAHMWAVTVTGAPKKAAMTWIEKNENTQRHWYGGAVGFLGVNGEIQTGLTLRAIHLNQEVAAIRVGATVLYDSDPIEEALETQVKAAAMELIVRPVELIVRPVELIVRPVEQVVRPVEQVVKPVASDLNNTGAVINTRKTSLKVLLIDHEDSFVHTLGGYFERCGCEVTTIRYHRLEAYPLSKSDLKPDLMVLSPGPGSPKDFNLSKSIQVALDNNIAIFGVCLGLQGLVEYFGGTLDRLNTPFHGKPSKVILSEIIGESNLFGTNSKFFETISVGRYHSLYARTLPNDLKCFAKTEDGVVMGIYHETLPIWAVQFHPESIMSSQGDFGFKFIEALVEKIGGRAIV